MRLLLLPTTASPTTVCRTCSAGDKRSHASRALGTGAGATAALAETIDVPAKTALAPDQGKLELLIGSSSTLPLLLGYQWSPLAGCLDNSLQPVRNVNCRIADECGHTFPTNQLRNECLLTGNLGSEADRPVLAASCLRPQSTRCSQSIRSIAAVHGLQLARAPLPIRAGQEEDDLHHLGQRPAHRLGGDADQTREG